MRLRTAKELLLVSWLLPMACTLLGGCIFALALSYLDYSNYRRSEAERLSEIAAQVGRRVYAEILLGDQGTLLPVQEQLRREFILTGISIGSPMLSDNETIRASWPLPTGKKNDEVTVERASRPFSSFVLFRHFLLTLLPTLLLAALGFLLQRRYLRTHFIEPIEALAQTTIGNGNPGQQWPVELQEIARKLSDAFLNRDQVVFGQLARGVIHDIKTNLNSIKTATELVAEAKDPAARQSRLEKLFSASQRNIPKIKEIIDTSLDTSRDIAVCTSNTDITETVRQAIQTLKELAIANNVEIQQSLAPGLLALHDPIQLERVFVNLLKNAIEATSESESPRKVNVTSYANEGQVEVHFEDSGPGFADSNNLIRPLKSTKVHGAGLGLFISKKIIDAHNGELVPAASSSLGGAKLAVVLPIEVRHE